MKNLYRLDAFSEGTDVLTNARYSFISFLNFERFFALERYSSFSR